MDSRGTSAKEKFSLYADLLDPSAASTPGTISSAPVTYNSTGDASSLDNDDAARKQRALAASLRFQPTKRPQLAAQKAKAKAIANKFAQPPTSKPATATSSDAANHTGTIDQSSTLPPATQLGLGKTTIADWTTTASDDEIVNDGFGSEKRPRGGRKKRKKNQAPPEIAQNWDDVYDPSRPNNYEDYKNSDEKIREVREWKDRLYAHRMRRRSSSALASDESRDPKREAHAKFAPPPAMSFAPPAALQQDYPPSPPPQPPSNPADDHTGEDAYARRIRLSQIPSLSEPNVVGTPPISLSPPAASVVPTAAAQEAPAGQISRAPVRYPLPLPPAELPSTDAELAAALSVDPAEVTEMSDQPRSTRPGQKGFAQRLMSKYGWTKGSGLGAKGTGIVNPLYSKADKRKKKSDAEGGGFATPTATGKIMGGQKNKAGQEAEQGRFGTMSEVVKLEGMLKGMDLDEELARGEGGIMQEIGEECGDKYGKVERVYIAPRTDPEKKDVDPPVFVQFVSQLSALRAVNALEGRIFNGNAIVARFWAKEEFDSGIYE